MKKKILALLVAAALSVSILAGCGGTASVSSETSATTQPASQTAGETTAKAGPLFDKPVTLRLMTPSHPSWPYQQDWYVVTALKEKLNVSFDVITVDDSNMGDKINVTMASGDVPEITFCYDIPLMQRYGLEGAYADVLDYTGQMPDFSKFIEEDNAFVGDYKSADGSLYVLPDKGISETDRMGWLYRKDLFDKHGLKVPTNDVEFYDVCKKLKELYPSSYPYAQRDLSSLHRFEWLTSSWGAIIPNDTHYLYYENNEWKSGAADGKMKAFFEFYSKLFKEKLVPPDSLTLDTKGWQDLISTNNAFITHDYLGRIDFFNNAIRPENPEFTMAYMPPWKGGADGIAKTAYSAYAFSGFAIAAKSPKLQETLKYMNWMYTPEAKELLSWGEEGKTYTLIDGKKKFIDVQDQMSMRKKYGLSTNGFYALFDYDAHVSLFTKELSDAVVEARKYDLDPIPAVAFDEQETNTISEKYDIIMKHIEENGAKFYMGDRPISEYDAFVKELQDLGLQDIIDIYTKAYNRQKGGN